MFTLVLGKVSTPSRTRTCKKNQVWAGYGFQLRHRGKIGMAEFEPATFWPQTSRATSTAPHLVVTPGGTRTHNK